MKLIVFTEKGNEKCDGQSDLISKLLNKNLLEGLTQEELNSVEDDMRSLVSNVFVEKYTKSKSFNPIMVNFYKINSYPTVIFVNDNEVIYKWENSVPSLLEVVTSIKNYLKILKLDIMDYNYDPED